MGIALLALVAVVPASGCGVRNWGNSYYGGDFAHANSLNWGGLNGCLCYQMCCGSWFPGIPGNQADAYAYGFSSGSCYCKKKSQIQYKDISIDNSANQGSFDCWGLDAAGNS